MALNNLVAFQPSAQQLTDYANALIMVNNYAYAITNQNLPVLNSPPPNYGTFASSFAPAKQHALNWTDNIFVQLVQFPTTITQEAAQLFNMEDTMITFYLQNLITNPNDTASKTALGKSLTTLQALITSQVQTATSAQQQLQQFGVDIASDAKILTGIAQDATADATGDQAQIAQINTDIANLKSAINTATILLTVSEMGIGISIFVGLIGVVCCFIPGAQLVGAGLIIVAVAGVAASIAGTVIENKRIAAMQAQIDSDQKQITGLNQDIILLNGVSQSFNDLYNANLKAQNALNTIITMWTNLGSTVQQVQTDLTDVENDNTADQYTQALADFQQAETAWAAVVAFAQALASINYSWQDTSGQWHVYGTQNPTINNGNTTQIPSSIAA
ncbi:MAG: hypothetical protein QOD12_1212 [Verrucomicrobiota bacterium]|jgi:hypothetical protein